LFLWRARGLGEGTEPFLGRDNQPAALGELRQVMRTRFVGLHRVPVFGSRAREVLIVLYTDLLTDRGSPATPLEVASDLCEPVDECGKRAIAEESAVDPCA